MHDRHLPALGAAFWAALCFASVFGANMGDFFAHDVGLGHLKGLPLLAMAFLLIVTCERFDPTTHEGWYWAAIVVIRTAATNIGDLLTLDWHLSRPLAMAVLALALAGAVWVVSWRWRRAGAVDDKRLVLGADAPYWLCMLLAGTIGTVMGDWFSHDLRLGDARAALVLGAVVAGCFALGGRGRLGWPVLYWTTVTMIRAAGTALGDRLAQDDIFGLAGSTLLTGLALLGLLVAQGCWRARARPS